MKADRVLCDSCGDEIKNKEREAAVMAVLVPEGLLTTGQKAAIERAAMYNLFGGAKQLQENFDLCIECCTALLVAMKSRQLQIKRHGKVVTA